MFRMLPPGRKHTREPGEGVRTSRQARAAEREAERQARAAEREAERQAKAAERERQKQKRRCGPHRHEHLGIRWSYRRQPDCPRTLRHAPLVLDAASTEQGIVQNIKQFIMTFGRGFSFVGN